jgi:hypothetical protein
MWLEYFSQAKIYGLDIERRDKVEDSRYTFVLGDQSSDEFWKGFLERESDLWDIVIDDGSHFAKHIETTFKWMWPRISSGGLYIIEDLACAYDPTCQSPGIPSQIEFVKWCVDDINKGRNSMESLQFFMELAVLKKK